MDIKGVVAEIEYKRGTTNTGAAIRYVDNVIFNENNGDRRGVVNVAVVVTDGNSNNKSDTVEVCNIQWLITCHRPIIIYVNMYWKTVPSPGYAGT